MIPNFLCCCWFINCSQWNLIIVLSLHRGSRKLDNHAGRTAAETSTGCSLAGVGPESRGRRRLIGRLSRQRGPHSGQIGVSVRHDTRGSNRRVANYSYKKMEIKRERMMHVQTLAGFGVMIWTMEEERGASVDFERRPCLLVDN